MPCFVFESYLDKIFVFIYEHFRLSLLQVSTKFEVTCEPVEANNNHINLQISGKFLFDNKDHNWLLLKLVRACFYRSIYQKSSSANSLYVDFKFNFSRFFAEEMLFGEILSDSESDVSYLLNQFFKHKTSIITVFFSSILCPQKGIRCERFKRHNGFHNLMQCNQPHCIFITILFSAITKSCYLFKI